MKLVEKMKLLSNNTFLTRLNKNNSINHGTSKYKLVCLNILKQCLTIAQLYCYLKRRQKKNIIKHDNSII